MTAKKEIIPAAANAANAETGGALQARARGVIRAAELNADEIRAAAADIAAADIAPGTRGNYEREFRRFSDFAAGREFTCELFAAYVVSLQRGGCKPSALRLAAAAVRFALNEQGRTDITNFPLTKKILRGARRLWHLQGGAPAGTHSAPLSADCLAISAAACAAEKTLIGLRDAAILRTAFSCLLRRGEIRALKLADLRFDADGSAFLTPTRVKTIDGARSPLLLGKKTAAALNAYIARAGINNPAAPIFQSVRKGEKATGNSLSANGIHRIFAKRCPGVSPHGARNGGAVYLAEKSAGLDAICRRGNWRTTTMAVHYTKSTASRHCKSAAIMAAV